MIEELIAFGSNEKEVRAIIKSKLEKYNDFEIIEDLKIIEPSSTNSIRNQYTAIGIYKVY